MSLTHLLIHLLRLMSLTFLPLVTLLGVKALLSHLYNYHCYSAIATLHEPHSFREDSTNPLWQQAMFEELTTLSKTHTWDLVDLPLGKTNVGCKWVYKFKTKSYGTVKRYKALLMAKGFN